MLAMNAPCLALLLTFLPLPSAGMDGEVPLRWQGKSYPASRLPDDFPQTARASIELWSPWCEQRGYRMALEDEARVLLITPGKKVPKKELRLVERVLDVFEREFAAPERAGDIQDDDATGAAEAGGDRGAAGGIPEDPEEGAHPWEVRGRSGVEPEVQTTSWGAENLHFDHDPAVLVLTEGQQDYRSLLDHLVGAFAYMESWQGLAEKQQGFVNAWPTVASFMRVPEGVEEWSPNNELVHRLGRLLFLRRYGRQPYWAELGVGWHFEVTLLGGIYVFPYRDEFVFAVEHGAWPGDLKRRFASRRQEPLRGEEFFAYERGQYLPLESRLSFGFMHFLARSGEPNLPAFFEGLRRIYDEQSVIRTGAHTWKRDLSYRIPPAEQAALARGLLGEDVFERASRAFRSGLGQKRRK